MEFWIKLIGIFLGVCARTYFPYIRKLKEGKITKFDKKYLKIAIGSFVFSFIITLLIFPQFAPQGDLMDKEAAFKLFCLAFGFGFGFNSIISEASEWKKSRGSS